MSNINIKQFKKFMLESNRIEGEDRVNPNDFEAVVLALKGIDTIREMLKLHNTIGEHLKKSWVGKFRKCDVIVGKYTPPHYTKVPGLMKQYMEDLPELGSWEAHNKFEGIHPFQDLNGRVGRLIWLSKAIDERYDFSIPFLQMYYYQTLSYYETNKC